MIATPKLLLILPVIFLSSCKNGNIPFFAQKTDDIAIHDPIVINPDDPGPVRKFQPTTPQTSQDQPQGQDEQNDNQSSADAHNLTKATIQTSKGDIVVQLNSLVAPNTTKNFISKINAGFYTNLTFHRVEDWVIQGGDPKGDGTGGGTIPTELSDVPFKIGSLGVARGSDINLSNDSQFFICTNSCSWLTNQYTNFGQVTSGLEIAKSIQHGDRITGITLQQDTSQSTD